MPHKAAVEMANQTKQTPITDKFIPTEEVIKDQNGSIIKRSKKDGTFSYQAKVRKAGSSASQTFPTEKEARNYLTKKVAKILEGERGDIDRFRKMKLSNIFLEYLEDKDDELTYGKKGRLRRLIGEIGNVQKNQFQTYEFEKYLKAKLKQEIPDQPGTKVRHKNFDGYMTKNKAGELVRRTYTESTVRKYYYDIRMAMEWHARKHRYPFDSKPFDEVPPPKGWANKRKRVVEEGEMDELLEACNQLRETKEESKALIKFLSYSAFRIGETFLIKYKHLHLDKKNPSASYIFIPAENQKIAHQDGAVDRRAAMRPELYELLVNDILKWPHKTKDEFIFACLGSSAKFYVRFKAITKNAETFDMRLHTLRHTAISWFFENTLLSDREISEISGHLDLNTLKQYAHLRAHSTGSKIWSGLPVINVVEQ